jgi:pimeloyl-ACP methyl ester carboxylesterase
MSVKSAAPEATFVEFDGKKTQLTVGGKGPPLLYLHSAGGETEWTVFHQLLAEHFTVYLPAHPGFALSTGLDQVRDIDDYAWHYVDLLAKLGMQRVPVVGFSLGGWIGMELAIRRPNLVDRLLLVNSAGLHVPGSPMAELFIDELDDLRQLLFFDPDSPVVDQAMPRSLDDPRILLWVRAREATARVGWNPYLHNPRLPDHLKRIECPVRILWGREDRLIPLAHGEFLAEHLPNAELRILEQCGHMLPFEKPNEFAAQTAEFLG